MKSSFKFFAPSIKELNKYLIDFSKIESRVLIILKSFFQQRCKERSRELKRQLKSKVNKTYCQFKIVDGQYSLNSLIQGNPNLLLDPPYPTTEIPNGIISFALIKNSFKIIEKSKRESIIPLEEISYMVSNYNQLQLCGRRIQPRLPIDPTQIEAIPQQLGYERLKYSRLTEKAVVKIFINHIVVPKKVLDSIKKQNLNRQSTTLFRLKFQVGEFHCYTALYKSQKQQNGKAYIQINEDIEIDVHDYKCIKVSLTVVQGSSSINLILNQILQEENISYTELKLSDFQGIEPLLCSIFLNNLLFIPDSQMMVEEIENYQNVQIDAFPLINCRIQLQLVNGSQETAFMEGPQLLVGGHCIYKNQAFAKVISINRFGFATIEILRTQPNYYELGLFDSFQVQVNKNGQGDLKMIERYGISHFNTPSSFFNNILNEWQLTLSFKNKKQADILALAIQQRIKKQQVQKIYLQRTKKKRKTQLVAGRLQLWIIEALNIQNAFEAKVQLTVKQLHENPIGDYIEYQNDDQFKDCIENSRKAQLQPIETSIKQGKEGNFSWVDLNSNPHGFLFDIGSYMKLFPHLLIFKLLNQNEVLGKCFLNTEEVISIDNFGKEFYLAFGMNQISYLRIRTLFQPSQDTIERIYFDRSIQLFSNAFQYLFYKVLSEGYVTDQYGYIILSGDYRSKVANKFIFDNKISIMNQMEQRIRSLREIEKMLKDAEIRKKYPLTNQVMNQIFLKQEKILKTEKNRIEESIINPDISQQTSIMLDIENLMKFGIPNDDIRVSIWKDLTNQVVNQNQTREYLQNSNQFYFKEDISVYENLKNQHFNSKFALQIEQDLKYYSFPDSYNSDTEVRQAQKIAIHNIIRTFYNWAILYQQQSNKAILYSRGMTKICQRLLTFMNEEDAFWILVGFIKCLKRFMLIKNNFEDNYVQNCPILYRKIGINNELCIINCLIQLHYPEIFAHLKSLSVPLEWYFEDAHSSMYSECFTSEIILSLWDMIVLTSQIVENYFDAQHWLLAVPLYMIKINHQLIIRNQDPKIIKNLLLRASGSINYDPVDFITELTKIIKIVFVKSDSIFNRIFKYDDSYKLDHILDNVETSFLIQYSLDIESTKKLASNIIMHRPFINIDLIPESKIEYLSGVQKVLFQLKLLSLRNLPIEDYQRFRIILSYNQNSKKTDRFTVDSVNEDNFNISIPQSPVSLEIHIDTSPLNVFLNDTLNLELLMHQDGNSISMGSVRIKAKDILNENITIHSLRLTPSFFWDDGFNNPRDCSVTIDISVKCQLNSLKDFSALPLEGFTSNDDYYNLNQIPLDISNDLILADQKECGIKTANEKILRNLTGLNHSNKGLECAKRFIDNFINISQKTEINQLLDKNFTQTILKVLVLSNYETVNTFLKKLYYMYESNLTLGNVSLLFHHLLVIMGYPLQFTEIQNALLNRTQIKSVTNYIAAEVQKEFTYFQRLLDPISALNIDQGIDVTDTFRDTVNQVVNQTGIQGRLDLTQAPFNKIEFWLRGSRMIKNRSTIINVSLVNSIGDISDFRYLFNREGIFQEVKGLQSFIPLSIYSDSQRMVTLSEFLELAHNNLPVLTSVIAQDLFMKTQFMNDRDLVGNHNDENDRNYEFNLSYSGKIVKIRFDTRIEKKIDPTLQQNKIISDKQSKSLYMEKFLLTNTIELSALERFDTFIIAQKRINLILQLVVKIQGLSNMPNIFSENFHFCCKSNGKIMNSFDRISSQQDNTFDLVYCQPENDDYGSLALYTHPNGDKEWRKCKIIKKISFDIYIKFNFSYNKSIEDIYKIEFEHERNSNQPNSNFYFYHREDMLLSFDYKASHPAYFNDEITKIVQKLGTDETLIQNEDEFQFNYFDYQEKKDYFWTEGNPLTVRY